MSHPGFPPPPPPGWGPPPADPGPIPLRPLTAGDLLGAGFGVVRRHLALLGPVAVLVSALSSAATMGILAGYGTLGEFASGQLYDDLLSGWQSGTMHVPAGLYTSAAVSMLISVTGTLVLSGLAAACVGVDAVGRQTVRGALAERLAGRTWPLLLTAIAVGVAVSIGLVLLIVPGVLVYLAWAAAAPATAMERSGPSVALQRSARLTRGHRGRILGMTLLIVVIGYVIESIVSAVALAAAGSLSPVASLVLSGSVTAVVAAVTSSWTGAVIALLYVDIRVRTENLAPALRAFAAADRARRPAGPALGQA